MRALVISGGGSKGAFAGGVAQYLIQEKKYNYSVFVGSSTGSLLIPHLALGKAEKIKNIFTSVTQDSIFSHRPFKIRIDKNLNKQIGINHINVLKQFYRGKKTFGESHNLRKLIAQKFTEDEFETLKQTGKEIIVTVSNLTKNKIEYKSIKDFGYNDFCDWIWISCNYIPFMSMAVKNNNEYADGGFGSMVPIEQAICSGAKIVDVIILDTELSNPNEAPSKNVFSLLAKLHFYMMERISKQNVRIGKLIAISHNALLNFYYTPTLLTSNSLIFDKKEMNSWWDLGYQYAKNRGEVSNEFRID